MRVGPLRERGALVATGGLVVVLCGVLALMLAGIRGTSNRTHAVSGSVTALSAYQNVQRALADEAFAEAGYRRAPSPSSRARVEAAISTMRSSVDAVHRLDSAADDGVVNYLLVLNGRYENEVVASLRDGSAAPGTIHDDRVAGPALDAMQSLVDAAVARRQAAADSALADQARMTHLLWILGPVALLVAVLLIGLSWGVVLGQQGRLRGRAEESEHRAEHDVLTGVGNRALLTRHLETELARRTPDAALLMVDLDYFKDINDLHGHGAGDEVLRAVAHRLQAAAGPLDVVARMGGDEFAILVRPASSATTVAALVQSSLPLSVDFNGIELQPGGSIGHVVLSSGMDERSALTAVDESLYAVKRNRVPSPRRSSDVSAPRGA